MPKFQEKMTPNEKGQYVLVGWIPTEYLELGFPIIKKSKVKSHTAILLRERAAWLLTKQPVRVRVVIEILEPKK